MTKKKKKTISKAISCELKNIDSIWSIEYRQLRNGSRNNNQPLKIWVSIRQRWFIKISMGNINKLLEENFIIVWPFYQSLCMFLGMNLWIRMLTADKHLLISQSYFLRTHSHVIVSYTSTYPDKTNSFFFETDKSRSQENFRAWTNKTPSFSLSLFLVSPSVDLLSR